MDERNVALHRLFKVRGVADRLMNNGMSEIEATAKATIFAKAAKALHNDGRHDNKRAVAAFVPGRIEVMGKHTDYCGGRSLVVTVEKGICFVAIPREDSLVRIVDVQRGGECEFELSPDIQPPIGHWSNYPMTVGRRIARNFPGVLKGCDIAIGSDLPPAAGLSSSSAMITGMFLVLSKINHLPARPEYEKNIQSIEDLAAYCGTIENGRTFNGLEGDRGVGTFGGSQDHTAILCCKAGYVSQYAFCPVRQERDIRLPEELTFVVVNSGVIAEKTGSALEKFNAVAGRAGRLVELWNKSSDEKIGCLADSMKTPEFMNKFLGILSEHSELDRKELLTLRLEQFIHESERLIPEVGDCLSRHSFVRLGTLVDMSQRLAETHLLNQVAETIELQHRAREAGAIAASAFGAGFGGGVWALCERSKADIFLARWLETSEHQVQGASGFVSRAGPPAMVF